MKDTFTNKELEHLEERGNDLILELFATSDKRYTIHKHIRRAYLMGREQNTDV